MVRIQVRERQRHLLHRTRSRLRDLHGRLSQDERDLHWRIYDEYGTIDLDYQVKDRNLVKFNLGIACSDYSITFGDLKGFIIGEDGTKYEIDDVGIGEDRSMKLL